MLVNGRDNGASSAKRQDAQCPAGIGFGGYAATLADNGWSPLPVNGKKPAVTDWTKYGRRRASSRKLAQWETVFPNASIGIVCGKVIGFDLDIMDSELVEDLRRVARRVLGAETPLRRIGRAPRCMLVYRAAEEIRSTTLDGIAGKFEVLSGGRQFVAFGVHPDTGRTYEWVGDGSPLDIHVEDLPAVTAAQVQQFLQVVGPMIGQTPKKARRTQKAVSSSSSTGAERWTRDERGRVVDGRDAFLFDCTMRAVAHLTRRGAQLTLDAVTRATWDRFKADTTLDRPKGNGSGLPWSSADAETVARSVLDRLARGELQERRTRTERPRKGGFWTKDLKDQFLEKARTFRELSGTDHIVLAAHFSDLNRDGRDVMAPSVKRLVEVTGLPERTVQRSREKLVRLHLLRRWTHGWGAVAVALKSKYRAAPYIPNDAVLRDGWQPFEIAQNAPSVSATSGTLNLMYRFGFMVEGGTPELPGAVASNSNSPEEPAAAAREAGTAGGAPADVHGACSTTRTVPATIAPSWNVLRQHALPSFEDLRQAPLPAELEEWTGSHMPPAIREVTRDVMKRWKLKLGKRRILACHDRSSAAS